MTRKRVSDEQYGKLTRRLNEVLRRVDEGTLDYDATMSGIQAFIEGRLGSRSLTVDCNLSLTEMIALGHYDRNCVNSAIEEHFKISRSEKVQVVTELVHPDFSISAEDIIEGMHRCNLRPATLAELLAYGAAHPEDQRAFPIIALGTNEIIRGKRYVAYLYTAGSLRGLGLEWCGNDWGLGCRFLAVHN